MVGSIYSDPINNVAKLKGRGNSRIYQLTLSNKNSILLKDYPDLLVISDELYSEISYFDPAPTYFYQHDPSLLKQTVIVDGISKSFACTGLRIGYCIADKKLTDAISKLQSQTTSGPNSLSPLS